MNMLDLNAIKETIAANRIIWRKHVLTRMMERGIRRQDVKEALLEGEVVEEYPNDKPFPSFLIAGYAQGHMLHIVAAYDKTNDMCYIITTYTPDTEHFESDLKTRR
jgi:hypothetical protein